MEESYTITHDELKKLPKDSFVIIDTRSPKEFEESHIPLAVNVPLLSNKERHLVGCLYVQQGRTPALKKGF